MIYLGTGAKVSCLIHNRDNELVRCTLQVSWIDRMRGLFFVKGKPYARRRGQDSFQRGIKKVPSWC